MPLSTSAGETRVIKVLVSSCLLGEAVRYHGGDARCASPILDRWREEGRLVPVCPETAGGLPVPRPPAEITGGDGAAVLRGEAYVGDGTGADVTAAFLGGARAVLETALAHGVRLAIFKDGSPSCATTYIHDGSFREQRVPGQGVAAALLSQAEIRVFSQRQLEEAAAYLEALEGERSSKPDVTS
jgi:uncharacterized protein YbbK (DUF523 family)